jgi:hypothetical protein
MLDELLALAGKGGATAGSSGGGGGGGGGLEERGGAFDSVHGRFEDQDGALCAAGYVTAAGISVRSGGGRIGGLKLPEGKVAAALHVFVAVAGCKNPTLAGTAAEAIGHIGLRGPLPLPRAEKAEEPGAGEQAAAPTAAPAATAAAPPVPAPVSSVTTIDAAVERLIRVMKLPDAAAAQRAARAAGYVIAGGCEWVDAEALLLGRAGGPLAASDELPRVEPKACESAHRCGCTRPHY